MSHLKLRPLSKEDFQRALIHLRHVNIAIGVWTILPFLVTVCGGFWYERHLVGRVNLPDTSWYESIGLAIWFSILVPLCLRLALWRCPRCRKTFFATWYMSTLFISKRCIHCGLSLTEGYKAEYGQEESR